MRAAATGTVIAIACASLVFAAARQRPPLPRITKLVMFDTPEADAILSALQVFPPDNPWNQDISALPVHADSSRIIASVGADKSLGYNLDMGFIIVPPDQKKVPVKLLLYADQSDAGPYPVPDNAPIENWPLQRNEDTKALPKAGQTLEDLQRKDLGVSGFSPDAQAILKGLKTYGMFVADNGSDWLMSIAPDRRLKGLESLAKVKGSDFEVVDTGARAVEGAFYLGQALQAKVK